MINTIFDNADKIRRRCRLPALKDHNRRIAFMPRRPGLMAHANEEGGRRDRGRSARRPARPLRSSCAARARRPGPETANTAASTTACRTTSELAICLIGRHFKAQYEFYAHARLAKEVGSRWPSSRLCVRARRRPSRDVGARLRLRDQYLATNRVSATTSARSMPSASRASSSGRRLRLLHAGLHDVNVFEMLLLPGEPDPIA